MSKMSASLSPRQFRLVRVGCGLSLVVALLVGASGCGGPKEAANSVSGKVTLGTSNVSGVVTFIAADGKTYPAPIAVNGTYSLANPPLGQVKLIVKSMAPVIVGGGNMPPPKDAPKMSNLNEGVAPPAKYGDAKTSDLTYEVKPGKQTYNIELKP